MIRRLWQRLRIVFLAGVAIPLPVLAQDAMAKGKTFFSSTSAILEARIGKNEPAVIAANIITALLGFLGILALALIVYGGFRWMLARGSEEEVKAAVSIIRQATIGLLIILASYGISLYVIGLIATSTGAPG